MNKIKYTEHTVNTIKLIHEQGEEGYGILVHVAEVSVNNDPDCKELQYTISDPRTEESVRFSEEEIKWVIKSIKSLIKGD